MKSNFQNQGENIFEFHIMNDGLYKKTVDGKLEVINPIEKGLTKIHRDFLNDNHNYVFQNTGTFNTFKESLRVHDYFRRHSPLRGVREKGKLGRKSPYRSGGQAKDNRQEKQ